MSSIQIFMFDFYSRMLMGFVLTFAVASNACSSSLYTHDGVVIKTHGVASSIASLMDGVVIQSKENNETEGNGYIDSPGIHAESLEDSELIPKPFPGMAPVPLVESSSNSADTSVEANSEANTKYDLRPNPDFIPYIDPDLMIRSSPVMTEINLLKTFS